MHVMRYIGTQKFAEPKKEKIIGIRLPVRMVTHAPISSPFVDKTPAAGDLVLD